MKLNLMLLKKNIWYLAHIWGAEVAAMGTLGEIMVREDPEPLFFINKAGVAVDLWKIFPQSKMLHNCLNEEHVCITYNPEFTPEKKNQTNLTTLNFYCFKL